MNNKSSGKIILIPTDLSEVCKNAIQHGAEIAQYLGYSVYLLHVVNKDTRDHLKSQNHGLEDLVDELRKTAESLEKKFKIKADSITRIGSIFTRIPEVARELNANLVVLGTHGKVGFQKLVGSFALKIILKSPCPVIVVQKRPFGKGYKNIVFPISDFMEDRQKVKWAIYLARTFNSTIHLFQKYAHDPGSSSRINIVTHHIKEAFDANGIYYRIVNANERGVFADQVMEYAVSNMADLVIIMTDTEVPDPRFKLAPWDETMIFNKSQIPVMCLNPLALSNVYFGL
ncbi:MAG: universal stress protein [Bacteroidetes bacterium]|nr:universal stress protein [Bacteroidota bacterium]